MANELEHDWTEQPKRLRGALSIRLPKPDEPASDERDEPERDR